ncbi:hypothetical protein D3C81_1986630 [compost metagenome]
MELLLQIRCMDFRLGMKISELRLFLIKVDFLFKKTASNLFLAVLQRSFGLGFTL